MIRTLCSRLSLSALAIACAPGLIATSQDQQKEREANSEVEERIRALDAQLRPLYEKMLRIRAENPIDYARDTPADIEAKERIIRRAGSDLYSASYADLVDYTPFALDYAWFLNEASVRLNGKVWRIGPDQDSKDVASIVPALSPGDLIVLDPGEYELLRVMQVGGKSPLEGVAIVGSGRESTTLKMEAYQVDQIRVENLTIECQSGAFVHPQTTSRVHMRDCLVRGYNGGHGGSHGLEMREGIALIEQSTFDGGPGRAQGRGGGEAIANGGDTWLFIRHTQFIDNERIFNVGRLAVLDGCISSHNLQHAQGVSVHSSTRLFQRDSDVAMQGYQPSMSDFAFAFDDLEVVKAAAGMPAQVDEETAHWIDLRELHRSLPYWIALIRHQNPAVRQIAANQITRLTGQEAAAHAEDAAENERLAELGALFRAEQEHTRLMNWYEQNQFQLDWDEARETYIHTEREPTILNSNGTGYDDPVAVADAFVMAVSERNWKAVVECFSPAERETLAERAIGMALYQWAEAQSDAELTELLESHEVDLQALAALVARLPQNDDAQLWNNTVREITSRIADREAFLLDVVELRAPNGEIDDQTRPRFTQIRGTGPASAQAILVAGAQEWPVQFRMSGERWFIDQSGDGDFREFLFHFLQVLSRGGNQ